MRVNEVSFITCYVDGSISEYIFLYCVLLFDNVSKVIEEVLLSSSCSYLILSLYLLSGV